MIDFAAILNNALGLVAGAGIVALWFKLREDKIARLDTELAKLRDKTAGDLHARFERHVEADRSQAFAAKLETVIVQNNNIMLELKKLNRESAAQGTTVARTEQSLRSLWDKFDACRQAHGGKS